MCRKQSIKSSENDILGTIYNAKIFELKQQILILENEKCEVKDKFLSHIQRLTRTKKTGVRATCQDLVMMGVDKNVLKKLFILC